MKTKILVMAGLIGLLAATFGFPQNLDQSIAANTPFSFRVGEKVLAAGEYVFTPDALEEAIQVRHLAKGGGGAEVVLVTRLAAEVHNMGKGHVVFDRIGNTYTLSEVWIPGSEGFLVNATKEKHMHRVIKAA